MAIAGSSTPRGWVGSLVTRRSGLTFSTTLTSDSALLHELAQDAHLGMRLEEAALPIKQPVRGACELLGLDPLHVANEGNLIAIVAPEAGPYAHRCWR